MDSDFVLTLDIGTTHIKTLAIDSHLQVVDAEYARVETKSPQDSYQQQDPRAIVRACESIIEIILGRLSSKKLQAIAISNAMHSILPVDDKGDPLHEAIIWSDLRSGKFAVDLKKSVLGKQLYMDTGTPIHPMSPLLKILWMKENLKDIFNKTRKFLSIKDYLLYHWFGSYHTDHSTASASGLFNINSLEWSAQALDLLGMDSEKLPMVTRIYHDFNAVDSPFFKKLNIPNHVPLVIGGTDGCLAVLGGGSTNTSNLSLSIGTSAAVRMARKQPVVDPDGRVFNYYLDENMFISGGPSNNGGNLLEWYRNSFFQNNETNSNNNHISFADDWSRVINNSTPGAEGLIFIPYIFGERAPIWDPGATGSFHGVRHSHQSIHFARSVIEGMIMNIRLISEIIDEGNSEKIILSGGVFNIPGVSQLTSDIFGKKALVSKNTNLSALGAAIVAWKSLKVDTDQIDSGNVEFEPDLQKSEFYSKQMIKFKSKLEFL